MGGMATWLLETLLKKGTVDHVIAVVPEYNPDQLFRFAEFFTTLNLSSPIGISVLSCANFPVDFRKFRINPGGVQLLVFPVSSRQSGGGSKKQDPP